jgi:hypothetical protein
MTDPVRRVHYFSGQLLTPEDLQAEQDYHREMRYLHNRLLGQGIVQGFGVSADDGSTLTVGPGLAIDPWGRELVLPEDVNIDLVDLTAPDGYRDLTATWDEEPETFVISTQECGDERPFTRWLERPRLALVPPGEAPVDSVVLGRVLLSEGRARAVDLGGRSTWTPAEIGQAEAGPTRE